MPTNFWRRTCATKRKKNGIERPPTTGTEKYVCEERPNVFQNAPKSTTKILPLYHMDSKQVDLQSRPDIS